MSDPQARALVALPGWTWAQGLPVVMSGYAGTSAIFAGRTAFVITAPDFPGVTLYAPGFGLVALAPDEGPDLDHPSAWGHLWAMLGEGWRVDRDDGQLAVLSSGTDHPLVFVVGPNLGRACAAALIARGYCGPNPPARRA